MQYLMYSENELRHLVAGWVNPTQAAVEGCNPGTVAKSKEALLKHLKVSKIRDGRFLKNKPLAILG